MRNAIGRKGSLVLLLLCAASLGAEVLYTSSSDKTFQVNRSFPFGNEVVLDFHLPAVHENPVTLAPFGKGSAITLDYCHTTLAEPGMPNAQGIQCMVEIPESGDVEVVVNESESTTIDNVTLAPAQHVVPEGFRYQAPYAINAAVYSHNGFYPQPIASLDSCQILRELRVAVINIHPVRYNAVSKRLELITKANISVKVHPETRGENELHLADKALTPSFMPLYQNVLNFAPSQHAVRTAPGCYLFMGPEKNLEAIQDLITWKQQKGFTVKTATPGKAGVPTEAKALAKWIQKAYAEWNPKPEYILMVGGEHSVPAYIQKFSMGPMSQAFPSDVSYVRIGTSKIPSMSIGRITGNREAKEDDPQVLQYIAWKTLKHDKMPADGDWRTKGFVFACHSVSGNDKMGMAAQKEFNEHVGGALSLINGTEIANEVCDKVMYNKDLLQHVQDGVSLVTYIGHGNTTIWGSKTVQFSTKEVPQFSNGEKFPISLSIACLAGNWVGNHCLYESFLDVGSMEDPKGMVAAFGFAAMSNEGFPNGITMNIAKNMFKNKMYKLGPAFCHALQFAHFGYDHQSAAVFGCPELEVYTLAQLKKITVEHGAVKAGTFQITASADGSPLENAMIGVTNAKNELLGSGYTDASGKAALDLKDASDEIILTVTGHHCRPYTENLKAE